MTARKLAELTEAIRTIAGAEADGIQVEHKKGGRTHILSKIQYGRKDGRITKRTMECLENGKQKAFDKAYDFDVMAIMVPGMRRLEY